MHIEPSTPDIDNLIFDEDPQAGGLTFDFGELTDVGGSPVRVRTYMYPEHHEGAFVSMDAGGCEAATFRAKEADETGRLLILAARQAFRLEAPPENEEGPLYTRRTLLSTVVDRQLGMYEINYEVCDGVADVNLQHTSSRTGERTFSNSPADAIKLGLDLIEAGRRALKAQADQIEQMQAERVNQ